MRMSYGPITERIKKRWGNLRPSDLTGRQIDAWYADLLDVTDAFCVGPAAGREVNVLADRAEGDEFCGPRRAR